MREDNVFGLPVTVGSRDEIIQAAQDSDGPKYYACMRVEDMSIFTMPPAHRKRVLRTPCENCGKIVWYDPKMFVPFSTVVCMPCLDVIGEGQEMRSYAQEEQVKEIRGYFPDVR